MNPTRIVNLTPHALMIYGEDPSAPVVTIPPEAQPARCTTAFESLGPDFVVEGQKVPQVRVTYGPLEGLPDPVDGTIYVVSSIAALAVPERMDVFIPTQMVYADGKIVGCRALAHV
jgi:hypothetical protein